MKLGVFGTGMVGTAIAGKLCALGHQVMLGARDAKNDRAAEWKRGAGASASHGTFAEAAAFGEIVFNCTLGSATLEVARAAGADNLSGKILIDVSNPLDFSGGMPPTLFSGNTDSLGEQLQRELPSTKVVKTLNTVNCSVMVDAARIPGEHDMFICGNDAQAKATVTEILRSGFGWKHVIDLGDISNARGTESYLPLWVRLFGALGTADFNLHVVRKP
jgi:8-hydroxy-5-deazaflavin:NADPH oxidoreductase